MSPSTPARNTKIESSEELPVFYSSCRRSRQGGTFVCSSGPVAGITQHNTAVVSGDGGNAADKREINGSIILTGKVVLWPA